LSMADSAQLFKLATKQVGLQHGIFPSFMAKPSADLPGCSGHIHISVVESVSKRNIFAHSTQTNNHPRQVSLELQYFLAGLLQALPSVQPLLVPNVNSYKRLNEVFWAPTHATWGLEDRLAAVRIVAPRFSSPESTRLEMRLSGSDINAHLAIAACLAAGLRGLQQKISLNRNTLRHERCGLSNVECTSDPVQTKLASSLREATQCMMEKDSIARQVLGNDFIEHYGATRLHEWKLWERTVTDWERQRYLEIV